MDFTLTITVVGDTANYSTNSATIPAKLVLTVLNSISKKIVEDIIAVAAVTTDPKPEA
jgi:hypothetical protein